MAIKWLEAENLKTAKSILDLDFTDGYRKASYELCICCV